MDNMKLHLCERENEDRMWILKIASDVLQYYVLVSPALNFGLHYQRLVRESANSIDSELTNVEREDHFFLLLL
jgi:hypothetical protein